MSNTDVSRGLLRRYEFSVSAILGIQLRSPPIVNLQRGDYSGDQPESIEL
jgi:hypothetical protein